MCIHVDCALVYTFVAVSVKFDVDESTRQFTARNAWTQLVLRSLARPSQYTGTHRETL